MFLFDTKTKEWAKQETTGEIPKELSYASSWYDKPYLFFHGGRNKQIALGDTYFLDTDTWVWRKAFILDQPSPRYYHCVVKGGEREAYLFGGYNEKRNKCLNDLHKYDYANLQFTSNDKDKVGGSGWKRISQQGDKPPARKGHQMVFLDNQLIVYGGFTNDGLTDDNFYSFALETKTWTTLPLVGIKPGARACHSMNFFKPDILLVFGGQINNSKSGPEYISANDMFMIETKTWNSSTPFLANIGPSNRFGHGSAFNTTFNQPEHVILGGLDKTFCTFDVFCIKETS